MAGQFEIYRTGTQYRWLLKSRDGEIVAAGEVYPDRQGVELGIEALRRAAAGAPVFDITVD